MNMPWISVALMSMYPVLMLAGVNIDEVIFSDVLYPLIISLISSLALYWFLLKLTGDSYKSSLIVLLSILFFYYYGHVFYVYISGIHFGEVTVGRHRFFFPIWVSIYLFLALVILKSKKTLKAISVFFNYLSIVLVASVIVSLIPALTSYASKNSPMELVENNNSLDKTKLFVSNNLPNIYYIILDGYASFETYKNVYDFDNSNFKESLEGQGFFVADQSLANHSYTYLSLSSTLNMQYMDWLASDNDKLRKKNTREIGDSIGNNKVAKILKTNGYRYITFDSGYSTSSESKIADLNVPCAQFSEFDRIFIKTTILDPFFLYGGVRDTILCQFDMIPRVAKSDKSFIFSHIIAPHPPFVFDSKGEQVGMNSSLNPWSDRAAYVEQTKFINNKVLEMISDIKKNSEIDPIIIIQSDHGPASSGTEEMLNPTSNLVKERMRILNTYYLPKKMKERLYRDITPVNTFRIILSELLHIKLPILKDISWFTPIGQEELVFDDVTDIAKYE